MAGKKTLFRLLTGKEPKRDGSNGNVLGLARVRDIRFDRLVEIYKPRKTTPAHIEFSLVPALNGELSRKEEALRGLERVDVICLIIRAFHDETVFHIGGEISPRQDILQLSEELALKDLLLIEKRLERLQKEKNRKTNSQERLLEGELLTRMRFHLEAGRFLGDLSLTEAEEKIINGYPFVTRKPIVVILNTTDTNPRAEDLMDALKKAFPEKPFHWIAVSAKIEEEVSQLDPRERLVFLEELGLGESALDRFTLLCYNVLGLISFFTVGQDEVRSWTLRRGSLAPQASRVIHSDLERGFIRAEVMKYGDLIDLGNEQKVKEAGRYLQKGRDYVVEDGDIISFLFHV